MGPFLMPLEFLQSSLIFPMRPGLSPLRASLLSEALKEELMAMRGGGELLHGHSLPGDPLPPVSFDFWGIFFLLQVQEGLQQVKPGWIHRAALAASSAGNAGWELYCFLL